MWTLSSFLWRFANANPHSSLFIQIFLHNVVAALAGRWMPISNLFSACAKVFSCEWRRYLTVWLSILYTWSSCMTQSKHIFKSRRATIRRFEWWITLTVTFQELTGISIQMLFGMFCTNSLINNLVNSFTTLLYRSYFFF